MGRTLKFIIGAILLLWVAGFIFRVLLKFVVIGTILLLGLYLVGALGNKRSRR